MTTTSFAQSVYRDLADLTHRNGGAFEQASLAFVGSLARASETLERDSPKNELEQRVLYRRVGVINELLSLTPAISRLVHGDYDQLAGMLKMVRRGEISFREGRARIITDSRRSDQLDESVARLSNIFDTAGYAEMAADQNISFGHSIAMSKNVGGREPSPDSHFATDATLLMRFLHPLGVSPIAKLRGVSQMAFSSPEVVVTIADDQGLKISIGEKETRVGFYQNVHGDEPLSSITLNNGESRAIGLSLRMRTVFGVPLDDALLRSDLEIPLEGASRAAYRVIRASSGLTYLFDAGARNAFSIEERGDGSSRHCTFDPTGGIDGSGRFFSGQSHCG